MPTPAFPAGRFQKVGLKPQTLPRLSAAVSVTGEPTGPISEQPSRSLRRQRRVQLAGTVRLWACVRHVTLFAPTSYGNLTKAYGLSPTNAAEIADDQTARIYCRPRRGWVAPPCQGAAADEADHHRL